MSNVCIRGVRARQMMLTKSVALLSLPGAGPAGFPYPRFVMWGAQVRAAFNSSKSTEVLSEVMELIDTN